MENFSATRSEVYPSMSSIRAEGKFCDVTICVADLLFPCHRVVLASASQLFYSMFTETHADSSTSEVRLKDIDAATFQVFLEFIYTGVITFTDENLLRLLTTSDYLGVPYIAKACESYLKVHTPADDLIVDILLYACNTRKASLAFHVTKIVAQHFVRMSRLDKLLLIPFRIFGQILSCRTFESKDHAAILEFLAKWVKRSHSRGEYLPELLQEIDTKSGINVSVPCLLTLLSNQSSSAKTEDDRNTKNEVELIAIDAIHDEVFRPAERCVLEAHVRQPTLSANIYTLDAENDWKFCRPLFDLIVHCSASVCAKTRLYTLYTYRSDDFSLAMKFVMRSNFDDAKAVTLSIPRPSYSHNESYSLAATDSAIYLYYEDDGEYEGEFRFHVYDCALNSWSYIADTARDHVRVSRYCYAAIATLNDSLYAFGGSGLIPVTNDCEGCEHAHFYDPRRGKWDRLPDMPTKRLMAAACSYKGKLYVSGGRRKNSLDVFDPATGKWNSLEPMPLVKYRHKLIPFKNCLWAIGGMQNNHRVIAYCLETNKWLEMPSLNEATSNDPSGSLPDDVFVCDAVVRELL